MKHHKFAGLLAVFALVLMGCKPSPEATADTPQVASPAMAATVEGIKSEAMAPAEPALDFSKFPGADASTFPKDGEDLKWSKISVETYFETKDAAAFVIAPTGRTSEGYPIFPLDCYEAKFGNVCGNQAIGQFTEEELDDPNKLPLVPNAAILSQNYVCGQICFRKEDGAVIGRVSKEAQKWAVEHAGQF